MIILIFKVQLIYAITLFLTIFHVWYEGNKWGCPPSLPNQKTTQVSQETIPIHQPSKSQHVILNHYLNQFIFVFKLFLTILMSWWIENRWTCKTPTTQSRNHFTHCKHGKGTPSGRVRGKCMRRGRGKGTEPMTGLKSKGKRITFIPYRTSWEENIGNTVSLYFLLVLC